jgi:hypothetical protein
MVSPDLPDTRYDYTHPWFVNANDRVAYERAFNVGTFEERQVAQAMLSQDLLTTNAEIRTKMTVSSVPPRFGYDTEEKTINDVIDPFVDEHVGDAHTTDFSGRVSGFEGTSIPSLPNW